MSRIALGDCLSVLPTLPDRCVDLAVTDLLCLVNYVDRTGRRIANDRRDEWLAPAFAQIFRVLRDDAFCISFYGWNRVDRFFAVWRAAGFRAVGHIVFAKSYPSKARFFSYRHEAAYLLAKGQPPVPASPLPYVMPDVLGQPSSPDAKTCRMPGAVDRDLQQAARHCSGPVRRLWLDLRGRALSRPSLLRHRNGSEVSRGGRSAP